MEVVYHMIKSVQKEGNNSLNGLMGQFIDMFGFQLGGERKVLFILDSKAIAQTFSEQMMVIGEASTSNCWIRKHVKTPCQSKEDYIFMLPNGIEVKVICLDN